MIDGRLNSSVIIAIISPVFCGGMFPMMRSGRIRENSSNFKLTPQHAYDDTLLQSMMDIQLKQKL
jgi:hypothetical protein